MHVLLVSLPQDLLEFNYLGYAALTSDNGPDSVLDGRALVLQILNLLDHDRGILLRLQAIDTVEEHCSMVVWDEICLPCSEELILQEVHNIAADVRLLADIAILASSRHLLERLSSSWNPLLSTLTDATGLGLASADLLSHSEPSWLHHMIVWIQVFNSCLALIKSYAYEVYLRL